mmetsp:Transcript_17228/g.25244  ORF Transcript_17228/g.25244 Transcript_17228/m.25244 type:complete len:542 (-) Transcript_17228:196-1821(-)
MSQQAYSAYGEQQPVVVQGTPVPTQGNDMTHPSPHDQSVDKVNYAVHGNIQKGEVQPKRCNDVFWALLFIAHLGVMAWVAATYAPLAASEAANYADYGNRRSLASNVDGTFLSTFISRRLEENDDQANDDQANGNEDYQNDISTGDVLFLVGNSFVLAFIFSALSLAFMMTFAKGLIEIALLFNVVSSLLIGIYGAMNGNIILAAVGFIGCAFTSCYAYLVWARIPFAAMNLKAGVSAIRSNFGVTFFAYSALFALFGWHIWFFIAFSSWISVQYLDYEDQGGDGAEFQVNGGIVFLFLLSYYWTYQVIQNTVHVTVSGTVGTWWFQPADASSCCSSGVTDSYMRAITYSFGSICLGSLIVAIVQAIKEQIREAQEEGNILLCILQSLLSCIENLIEYFNNFAYVYVAVYGYPFIEAGKNVFTLFQARGWTTIITDNLVDRVLMMMSVVVGLIIGLFTLAIATAKGVVFDDEMGGSFIPFIIGFMVGAVITNVLMNVVGSAVTAVIVCYAEAPAEFSTNHPELSDEMRAAWRQAWPTEFNY